MTNQTLYQTLCDGAQIHPVAEKLIYRVSDYGRLQTMIDAPANERMTSALAVFLNGLKENDHHVTQVDHTLIDEMIALIDQKLSVQLDEILHSAQVQQLESLWRGLDFLLNHVSTGKHVKISLLDVSKSALQQDFKEAGDTQLSGLYQHVYVQEYDTPGGEPFSTMITNEDFVNTPEDLALLRDISAVAAAAHCPFIGNVGAAFFGKNTAEELSHIPDIRAHLDKADYMRWQSFRRLDHARYIGMTLPKFLLRLPYGDESARVRAFSYTESLLSPYNRDYLWGAASFAFAANMARSFCQYGWTMNIRGPESGGRLDGLPMHQYDNGFGLQTMSPVEMSIPESRELALANAGFIPLSHYKNSDYACFFSANALHEPPTFDDPELSANMRINNRLPYIYLVSQLAQHLKVLQRENIGSQKGKEHLEYELNAWLSKLVTKTNRPSAEVMAQFPLAAAEVTVHDAADNPGYYRIDMKIVPHFQVEGMDITLSLVSRLPRKKQ